MYFGEGALTGEQKAELSRKVTDLLVREAKQPQRYTWVIIHEIPAENWMVDRLTIPELKAKLKSEKRVIKRTNAEKIMRAVASIVKKEGKIIFSRKDIRDQIGVSRKKWDSSYTAIFQGMRSDQPGGAPKVAARFKGVFRQVERGRHTLTDYGKRLIKEFDC